MKSKNNQKKFYNHNRLKDLRDDKDLKSKDIAKILNISSSAYSAFETMKSPIPTKRLVELANYHEVNIDYMLNLTNKKLHIKTSNDIDIKVVSSRVKRIRKKLKLSIDQLAQKLNVSTGKISEYENGKYLISGTTLVEFAKLSNYSLDYMLGRSDIKEIK